MRLTNERDQQLLRAGISDSAASLLEFMPTMGTGEAVTFGEGVSLPTRIKFDMLAPNELPRSSTASFTKNWANDIGTDQFLHEVYEAVTTSPNWEKTVLVVNFDEWGGFYDHVAPTEGPDSDPFLAQRGFRVPCLVASPLARRNHIAHDLYDHTSVLKMIEWGFDLRPLSVRDAHANNLADVLDLSGSIDTTAPEWDFPEFEPLDCTQFFVDNIFDELAKLAREVGMIR